MEISQELDTLKEKVVIGFFRGGNNSAVNLNNQDLNISNHLVEIESLQLEPDSLKSDLDSIWGDIKSTRAFIFALTPDSMHSYEEQKSLMESFLKEVRYVGVPVFLIALEPCPRELIIEVFSNLTLNDPDSGWNSLEGLRKSRLMDTMVMRIQNQPPLDSQGKLPTTPFSNIPEIHSPMLPLDSALFHTIRDHLLENPMLTIWGPAGSGKSHLAAEYAKRFHKEGNHVIWIYSGNEAELKAQIVSITLAIGLIRNVGSEASLAVPAWIRWLKTCGSWLMVIDGAESIEPLVNFLPSSSLGFVLITSRSMPEAAAGNSLPMFPLSAGTWKGPKRSYPGQKQKNRWKIEDSIGEALVRFPELSMIGKMMACMGENPIPLSVFRTDLPLRPDAEGKYRKLKTVFLYLDREGLLRFDQARKTIMFFSEFKEYWDRKIPNSEAGLWLEITAMAIHFELVRYSSRSANQAGWTEISELLPHIRFLKEHAKNLGYNSFHIAKLLGRTGKIVALLTQYDEAVEFFSSAVDMFSELRDAGHENDDVEAEMLHDFGKLQLEIMKYTEAELLLEKSRRLRIRLGSSDSVPTWETFYALALVQYRQGNYQESKSFLMCCLEMRSEADENGKEFRAKVLNLLSALARKDGRFKEAEILCLDSLRIRRENPKSRSADIANNFTNLGHIRNGMGKYQEALSQYQSALEIRQALLGKESPITAESHNDLANIHRRLGDFKTAECECQISLEIRKRVFGEEHLATARSFTTLAQIFGDQGRHKDEAALVRLALKIQLKFLPPGHLDVAANYYSLGKIYRHQGEYVKARKLFHRCLEIRSKALRPDHVYVAVIESALAKTYLRQKPMRADLAEQKLKRSAEIRKKALGDKHPFYASCMNDLGDLYMIQGKYELAKVSLGAARKIRAETLGETHPKYGKSCYSLGILHSRMFPSNISSLPKAERYLAEALDIWGKTFPPESPNVQKCRDAIREIQMAKEALKKQSPALHPYVEPASGHDTVWPERTVEAWIEGDDEPALGRPFRLGISLPIAIGSAAFRGQGQLANGEVWKIQIVPYSAGALCKPQWKTTNLEPDSDSDPVYFDVTPTEVGKVRIRIKILSVETLVILQELESIIDVPAEAGNTILRTA